MMVYGIVIGNGVSHTTCDVLFVLDLSENPHDSFVL